MRRRGSATNRAPLVTSDGAKEQAAKYLKETGEELAFTMLVPPDPTIAHVASLWRLQLAEAGIDLQLQPVEQPDARPRHHPRAVPVGDGRRASPIAHPDLYEPLLRGIPAEQPAINTNIHAVREPGGHQGVLRCPVDG